ncbi:sulfite exporter TauE/SafE family protein [soil metagenome]
MIIEASSRTLPAATMPDAHNLPLLALVAAVFVLAGFVKGVIGLGLPTITMGLLSVVMLPVQAAALLVVPSLVTNLWQIGGPGLAALLRRMAPMLLGVCFGVAAGAGWLTGSGGGTARWASGGLGLALIVYAALGLMHWHPRVAPAHEGWLGPLVGVATGLVTAATGVFVIPAVPYLQALGMEKEELVRALGISFLVSTIALALSLGQGGALEPATLLASLIAVAPALAGMMIGQWLRLRVSAATFKKIFLVGLLLLGAYLAIRAMLA